MNLPLQKDIWVAHPWWRRSWWIGAGVVAILLLNQSAARHDYVTTVAQLCDGAERRIWIMMYVVRSSSEDPADPVRILLHKLQAAQQRGVEVALVLDASKAFGSDELDSKHTEAAALCATYNIPVIIDDLERRSHAKVVLLDDHAVVIGSHNWTTPALRFNREASVVIYDQATIKEAEGLFRGILQP
jgi:phosphatidylserine/phosphatidylglycerophosphate/cardiolipin synthase-like enzyme